MNFSGNSIFQDLIFLQSVLRPASFQADRINRLFNFFNLAAAGMFLLVVFLIIYICIHFRQRKGDNDEPVQTSENRMLETAMIGVPTLLLIFFFYQTMTTMNAVANAVPEGRKPDIIITGHQWWWEVSYPGANVITANEVHLPVGKQVLMELRSADVIHDWWVPQLGNKMDLIPNHNNYLWLEIHKAGKYLGACSEFCGAQHAWMRIQVIAESEKEFDNWLAANQAKSAQPSDELARNGSTLFQSKSCGSCHRIAGTTAAANVGPDLTHLASRQSLLTGLLENNQINLIKWISHPQKVKPGSHMPDFNMDRDSVIAIVHYLNELK